MAESAPGVPPPGEVALQAQLQAIKAKQAAGLIAVREKYEKEIQSQESDFDKRWDELTKGNIGTEQKESTVLTKSWAKHELKTRPGEYPIGLHPAKAQVDRYKKVLEEYSRKTIIPMILNKHEARLDLLPQILNRARNALVDPVMEGKENLDRATAAKIAEKIMPTDNKLTFISALLTKLKNAPVSLLIVAESPIVRKSVEAICVAKGVSAVLYNDVSSFQPGVLGNSIVRVGIASTRYEGQNTMKNAHFIVAMDETFDPVATHIQESRKNWHGTPGDAPVLRLFYFNTFEQLAFIFTPDPAHRTDLDLRDLIKYSFTNLIDGGGFDCYETGPEDLVQKLYEWMSSAQGKPKVAPMAYLPKIPEMRVMNAGPQPITSVGVMASAAVSPRPDGYDAGNESEATRKRKRIEQEAESSKRPKPAIDPKTVDVTAGGVEEVYDESFDYNNLTKDELVMRLRALYKRHKEHVHSQNVAQKLHIEARDAFKALSTKVEDQATAIDRNKDTIARLRGTIDNLKTERSELQRRVRELQDAIEKGDSSESVKNWRRLQAENNSLKDQLSKRDDKIKQKESDLEFFREQYQTASSNAAGFSNELEALKEEHKTVKEQADGAAVKLREMSFAQERKELQAKLKAYKGEIELKERKIAELVKLKGGHGDGFNSPRTTTS